MKERTTEIRVGYLLMGLGVLEVVIVLGVILTDAISSLLSLLP